MNAHYNNCLYIHGLHSNVNEEKVAIMRNYFPKVTARHFIYHDTPDCFDILQQMCSEGAVDFIIGSSFGGYLGFYLSRELGLPALLFNPAVAFRSQDAFFIREECEKPSPFACFIIGQQDDVIPPESTDKFLRENPVEDRIEVIRCSWLGHRIDLRTFDAMVAAGLRLSREGSEP